MPNDFCTLFDVNYLPRALVLYHSLDAVCESFTLRAYCMDERAGELLEPLDLPGLTIVPLAELERDNLELASVKSERTQVEYCWTATPAICLDALRREPGLAAITYLDADLMFFSDPAPLYAELGDDSVLIVPHRYTADREHWTKTSGVYNVEWLTFRNEERGLTALRWWYDRCIEWCYNRVEDGKFGDQMYLDDWPERFPGVHVLQHPGGGLAPWNVERYRLREENGQVLVDDVPLVFFHFHSLRLYQGAAPARRLALLDGDFHASDGVVWRHGYPLDGATRRLIWEPYLDRLGVAVQEVRSVDPGFDAGFESLERLLLQRGADSARYRSRRAAEALRRRLRGDVSRQAGS